MSTATTVPAAAPAVDTEPIAPVPPERLAILLALGVRDGLPVWQGCQLITERPGPDDAPLLAITFPTHQAADAWAALMTEPYRTVHSDGHVSIHAGWHGWRVIVSGVGLATQDLDEETAALAAQLDDGSRGGPEPDDLVGFATRIMAELRLVRAQTPDFRARAVKELRAADGVRHPLQVYVHAVRDAIAQAHATAQEWPPGSGQPNPNWPVDLRTAREATPRELRWTNKQCTTCGYFPPCQCPGFPFGTGTGLAEAVTR